VEWSSGQCTAYFQRFSLIYDALMELQHQAPGAEALRRIPGKRAFSSLSASSRDRRAAEIHDVLTACVHEAALAQSSTLIDLLSPPHASSAAAHGCAVTPSPNSRAWTAPEAATDASLRELTPTTLQVAGRL